MTIDDLKAGDRIDAKYGYDRIPVRGVIKQDTSWEGGKYFLSNVRCKVGMSRKLAIQNLYDITLVPRKKR